MRSFLLFTTVVCAVNCVSNDLVKKFGDSPEDQGSRSLGIYGGKDIYIEKAPYTVVFLRPGKGSCAGAILNEKWVVTSGDCTRNMKPSDLTILAGSDDGETGQRIKSDKIVSHPNYSYVSLDYDIALVRNAGVFKWSSKVKPVSLPTTPPKPKTEVIASGYGATKPEVSGEANRHLQAGIFYWQSTKFCKGAYRDVSSWTPRMACAYNKGKTTLCEGDWADPLVSNKEGNATLWGVFIGVGSANFCSHNAEPLILANVRSYVEWILSIIGL